MVLQNMSENFIVMPWYFCLHFCISGSSVQRGCWGQCLSPQAALLSVCSRWFIWNMWLYVSQSHILTVETCQSHWHHPLEPDLSFSQTGTNILSQFWWAGIKIITVFIEIQYMVHPSKPTISYLMKFLRPLNYYLFSR